MTTALVVGRGAWTFANDVTTLWGKFLAGGIGAIYVAFGAMLVVRRVRLLRHRSRN